MKITRRGFFGNLFRSVAVAAALIYTPSVLAAPRMIRRGSELAREWETLKAHNPNMRVTKDRYIELRSTEPDPSTWTNEDGRIHTIWLMSSLGVRGVTA